MKNNLVFKVLLSPFSLLFASIISLRNIIYETGLLKSTSFNLPVINVGNLTVGGTGKTPHIEYLIRLLSPYIKVSTLSRGYKRKSKGFRLVGPLDNAIDSGDEPLQYKKKFPSIPVAVSESRNIGIPMLIRHHPEVQAVLLDDAFQHRSVVPGLNILLTEYGNLFVDDMLLPAGRLREPKSSYVRADIIIVTKTPFALEDEERERITKKIKPYPFQKLLFSKYEYGQAYFILDQNIKVELNQSLKIQLISAIASVDYLLGYLNEKCIVENVIKFEDHHYFSEYEMEHFNKIASENDFENTIFLTTEKDATRLLLYKDYINEHQIPIFVLPVNVSFHDEDNIIFDQCIKQFLLNFKV